MNHSGEIYTHLQMLVKKTPDYDRAFEILKSEINRAHSTFITNSMLVPYLPFPISIFKKSHQATSFKYKVI